MRDLVKPVAMPQSGRRRGAFVERVLALRLWGETPFHLVDAGCRGGIERRWKGFDARLRANGFDPFVAEIERLSAANTHPGITYEAAFVTCAGYDRLFQKTLRDDPIGSRTNQPFQRVSASAALRRLEKSYNELVLGADESMALTTRSVTLDDYFRPEEHPHVDFLKIDTDGADIQVILGAEQIMAAGGVLGLTVEVQFHGATHEFANTFSNIDRVLRQRGFTLFDLQSQRYSRADLPAPFVTDLCAQTTSGQLLCGEGVYFRDVAATEYEQMWPYEITPERVMKLACLFELFDLPDCAAELLINRGGFLDASVRSDLLDLLATGEPGSYAAHVAAFERDHTLFYPSRRKEATAALPALQSYESGAVRHLQERVAKLLHKNAKLEERLKARDERVEWLTGRIEELKAKRHKRDEM